jgi:hypothetical protein
VHPEKAVVRMALRNKTQRKRTEEGDPVGEDMMRKKSELKILFIFLFFLFLFLFLFLRGWIQESGSARWDRSIQIGTGRKGMKDMLS